MNKEGFYVTEEITRQLGAIKSEQGITNELASCHTAMIDGYVVEGHVHSCDVQRLLEERPDAIWTLSSWHARGVSRYGRP